MKKIDKDLFELAQLADGSTFTVSGNLEKGCKRFTTSSDGYIYFENDPVKGSFTMTNNDENIKKAFAWLYDDEVEIETSEVKITAHTYVCEIPETIQNKIFQECESTFKSLAFPVNIKEELENVKGCKMCDLEDTINVQKYYTR